MLAELDALLAQPHSESQLSELLYQASFYAVEDDGLTYRQWLQQVRAAFVAALEAKPPKS